MRAAPLLRPRRTGHVEFFSQARALGDRLVVSFASDDVLAAHKGGRRSSIPQAHKAALIGALRMVDEVVVGTGERPALAAARPTCLAAPGTGCLGTRGCCWRCLVRAHSTHSNMHAVAAQRSRKHLTHACMVCCCVLCRPQAGPGL